jgi:hypothetical protein
VSLTGPKSKSQEDTLRSIILEPNKCIKEAKRKEAELLKSSLYQVIYTNVLCPIESSSFKKRKASSGLGGEAEEEDNPKLLKALKKNNCAFPIIQDLLGRIMREYKRLDIGYSNSDDKRLGEFVDMLLEIIGVEEVSESVKLVLLGSFFKLFFSKSQVAEDPAKFVDASNFHKQPVDFKCKQPWNDGLMRRDNHDNGLVPNTPFCLWTALHLAMIDAGVPEMSGDMDRQKIKEQCLGFMLNDERAKQTTDGKFKKEFASMRFIIRKESGDVQNFGVSEFYEVLL